MKRKIKEIKSCELYSLPFLGQRNKKPYLLNFN